MSRLPLVSGREVVNALKRLGFLEHHQTGSHKIMKHTTDASRRAVVPMHDEIRRGTLRAILRDARVTEEEFVGALR